MSEIRRYFTSRFEDGFLMEFDFSQLEVVALAQLSRDRMLIKDILDGVDLHTRSASLWLGIDEADVTQEQRKKAKQMTFQLQYGAGYKSMADKLGLHPNETKAFIVTYYDRYKGVKAWQQNNIDRVKHNRKVLNDDKTPKGNPQGSSSLLLPTGRILRFKERDFNKPVWWPKLKVAPATNFWDTEIKNYPVQSFATGDIVPHMLGKVYRVLKNKHELDDKALLINTVHDSMVFDVENEAIASTLYNLVMPVLENTNHYLKQDFNIDMIVPITADCKWGKNWMEMEDYSA